MAEMTDEEKEFLKLQAEANAGFERLHAAIENAHELIRTCWDSKFAMKDAVDGIEEATQKLEWTINIMEFEFRSVVLALRDLNEHRADALRTLMHARHKLQPLRKVKRYR